MNLNKWQDLLKIAFILYTLILLVSGYIVGYYVFYDVELETKPLFYGIKQINVATQDNYSCSCTPQFEENSPFQFSEEGLVNFYWVVR